MKTQLTAQVEKLVAWRISDLDPVSGPSVDAVLASFKRANFNTAKLPVDITGHALRSFRQRSDGEKRKLVQRVLLQQSQAQLPNVAPPQTVPATVPEPPVAATPAEPEIVPATASTAMSFQPPSGNVLAGIAAKALLEMKEEDPGEVYITLRSFEPVTGKSPENLRRTLAERKLPVRQIKMLTGRNQLRDTPAIHVSYLPLLVGMADLHGMDPQGKERLFFLQRSMPDWAKRLNDLTAAPPPAPALPPAPSERSLLGSVANTIMGRLASAFTTGLSKLEHRLDVRFDRLERLLHQYTSPPAAAPSPSQNGAHVEPRWARPNGTGKITSRPPHRDVNWVTGAINNALGTTTYTPQDIIRIAQRERIYDGLWVMDKVGIEPAIILDDGEKVTKWFDQDAIEVLKDVTRKETVAQNSAPA